MNIPPAVSSPEEEFSPEFLGGVYVNLAGGVEYRTVCPRLVDLLRRDLMEVKGMHAPEELWQRLKNFRKERESDPGWRGFFRATDNLISQKWQEALTDLYESRAIFLDRNDAWAARLVDLFIRDADVLRRMPPETDPSNGSARTPSQKMIDDELLWQWWRINHLPWQ